MALQNLDKVNLVSSWEQFYVYAVFCEHDHRGFVKIGYTVDPIQRIQELQVGCPMQFQQLAVMKAGTKAAAIRTEGALQEKFKSRKTLGEWFEFDFSSQQDKEEFNQECRAAFSEALPKRDQKYWKKFSSKQIAEAKSKHHQFKSDKHRNRRIKQAFLYGNKFKAVS